MIERGFTKFQVREDGLTLGFKERAYLDCGCSAYIGIRFDNHEAAMGCIPCSEDHYSLMEHFSLLYKESLAEPQNREAVVVAEEILEEAERNY